MDDAYRVFHVKRRSNQPVVVRTPIDQVLETRHIKISENKCRQYYGLPLARDVGHCGDGLDGAVWDHYC